MKLLPSVARLALLAVVVALPLRGSLPLAPVTAPHGMVVAAHPEAAALGRDVLQAGGNAIDAAVAVSLALGVTEPYGSGLGGKLVLLYFDAASGRTFALDAMDAAGRRYRAGTAIDRDAEGWSLVCVPGLPAGLHEAHRRWGRLPWAETVRPVAALARRGYEILPKTRQLYGEQLAKLRKPFAREAAAIYLPGGELPAIGERQANPDLATTLDLLAAHGRDGFYRGQVADAIVAASEKAGGWLTREDFADYQPRLVETIGVDVGSRRVVGLPPPAYGAALIFATLRAFGAQPLTPPLRTAANLDAVGRTYLRLWSQGRPGFGDIPQAYELSEALIRNAAKPPAETPAGEPDRSSEGTTHFVVADAAGNVVTVTQSLSLHFGAGVVAPGTGVVMNNTMSNFSYRGADSANSAAPGKRPTSTIAPLLVFEQGRPVVALGLPGSTRIPSGLLQVMIDFLQFGRPLAEAIADTRVTWVAPASGKLLLEAESSLPPDVQAGLKQLGWTVDASRTAGGGSHFGGVNAIILNADGSRTGLADPRRTNAAAGY